MYAPSTQKATWKKKSNGVNPGEGSIGVASTWVRNISFPFCKRNELLSWSISLLRCCHGTRKLFCWTDPFIDFVTRMAQPAMATISRLASPALRQAVAAAKSGVRLGDSYPKELVDDIFAGALKKQTGVSLKYMYVNALQGF
jgi:hypothetical protein